MFDLEHFISECRAALATEPGPLKVAFLDTHGGKYEGTADIKLS